MQSRSAREVNDYKYLQVRNEEYETLRELWWTGPNAYDSPPDHWLPGKCMLVSSMPVELLFMVCGHLYQADLMHLAVTCKTMADFTLPLLYTRDVAEFDCIALRWACTTGVTATLERTLQYGAPPNYFFDTHGAIDCDWVLGGSLYNDTYNTPLKIAICADEPEAVRLLCEKGIDVNTPDFGALQSDVNFWPLQFYPINWALGSPDMPPRKPGAQLGNPKIVRYLLDAGADPNQYSIDCFRLGPRQRGATHSTTPLLMAMHSSVPVETVRLLLERGADPTMVGSCLPTDYRERSQSPLDVLLLSYGLDIPGFAFDWEKAGLLLSHGSAEHTICLRSGRFMPLLYRYLDFPEIAKLARLFIDAGADLFDWTNWGVPPILAVMWWAGARILDSCDAVDVKETTRLVTTMGELVALFAEATVVTDDETDTESPIRKSAIIDATPAPFLDAPMRKADQTPLRYACSPFTFVGANLLVPILLNHGANINGADAEGVTPLHLAAMFSTGHVVRTLTEFNGGPATLGLDVNSRDARGWTPLHYACQFGFWSTQAQQVDAARLLLKSGADVRARTAGGWTPLLLAVRSLNSE
ncbi:ankyrin repeat-containing domain protein, partial [Podospora appendiculata]